MTLSVQSLGKLSHDERIVLLRALGYGVEDGVVVRGNGSDYEDPCTGMPVRIDNMLIMPGSVIVMDANESSATWYAANYVD